MTTHRSGPLVVLALVTASLAFAGCSAEPGSVAVASTSASSMTLGEPSASPVRSIEPSTGTPPFGGPSVDPSIETPSESPVAEPVMPEPPPAWLAVEGGDPVTGELGSFGWMNGASDAPWVPGTPMHVGGGERLTFGLAAPVRVANWTVARTPAATVGSGEVGMGEGVAEPITFAAPPRGTWSVNVSVLFADNIGSAAYYWLVTVD